MGNIVNRVFDSSGPEGKVRGTPQQIIDKYAQLARDAQLGNDRVAAENFQQHAEHYTRLLGEALREQEARREAQDAQNRNRQRDRDATRGDAPAPAQDPGAGPQPEATAPDVIDVAEDADSGLVETPENTGSSGGRRRKSAKSESPSSESESPQEAAE